ncbi:MULTISPECIES: hypothetical protein [unclassified Bradyrhizobium]
MAGDLKPIDLYDIARMCSMAYRANPSLAGWQAFGAGEMRLTDARLYATPYISPNAVAWYKRAIADRSPIVVVVIRGADATVGDSEPTSAEVAAAAEVVSAVMRWAATKGDARFVVAGCDAGARIAKAVATAVDADELTVVAFGRERRGEVPDHIRLFEIVAAPSGERRRRADGYLAEIRALYEAGDLAEMLGRDDAHTIIELPEHPGL